MGDTQEDEETRPPRFDAKEVESYLSILSTSEAEIRSLIAGHIDAKYTAAAERFHSVANTGFTADKSSQDVTHAKEALQKCQYARKIAVEIVSSGKSVLQANLESGETIEELRDTLAKVLHAFNEANRGLREKDRELERAKEKLRQKEIELVELRERLHAAEVSHKSGAPSASNPSSADLQRHFFGKAYTSRKTERTPTPSRSPQPPERKKIKHTPGAYADGDGDDGGAIGYVSIEIASKPGTMQRHILDAVCGFLLSANREIGEGGNSNPWRTRAEVVRGILAQRADHYPELAGLDASKITSQLANIYMRRDAENDARKGGELEMRKRGPQVEIRLVDSSDS